MLIATSFHAQDQVETEQVLNGLAWDFGGLSDKGSAVAAVVQARSAGTLAAGLAESLNAAHAAAQRQKPMVETPPLVLGRFWGAEKDPDGEMVRLRCAKACVDWRASMSSLRSAGPGVFPRAVQCPLTGGHHAR